MNKNRLLHSSAAAVCAVLCLAILLCITSCFNLSSTQRGNFSFTISEDVAQQLENALGPRWARSAGAPVITATVTLTRTAGGELTTPVAKSGTIASLINETFTFEDLPLHVPFTVSVSFKANGKEIFSGTSEPITLTSADATPVAIALYHMLDTDIVVPYWENIGDGYAPIGFRAGSADELNTLPDLIRNGDFDYANTTGAITSCFDSYGNVWSVDTRNYDFRMGTYNSMGVEGLYFSGSEPFVCDSQMDLFTTGFLRAFIPGAYCIACDYATNELYIICDIVNNEGNYGGTNIVKLSVDEMLSYNPESDFVLPSYMENLNAYTELIADMNGIGYQITYVPSLLSGYGNLYDILGTDVPDPVDHESLLQYGDITSFTVNNGIMYVGYAVLDSNDDIIDWSFASINPATGAVKHTDKDLTAIFGNDADPKDISITDMLYQDGKLYALVSYKSTTGALIRIDPATLTFGVSDVLGVSSDIRTVIQHPDDHESDYWKYRRAPQYEEGAEGDSCYFDKDEQGNYYPVNDGSGHYNQISDGFETLCYSKNTLDQCYWETATNYLISNDSRNFLGPVKFVAIKPKKLIVADYGIFYSDGTGTDYKTRLLTIDLANFSIDGETPVSFNMTNPNTVEPATIDDGLPFYEGQELWFNTTGDLWGSVTFTESMIVDFDYYDRDSDNIPIDSIYYWD